MQQRYWNYLVQVTGQSHYLNIYRERSEEVKDRLNIILAIASSVALGAWVTWQGLEKAWALVIVGSQIMSAIMPYLPYSRRIEILGDATRDFRNLSMRVEVNWFKVADGRLSEDEINELLTAFRKEQLEIEDRFLSKVRLTDNPHLAKQSEEWAHKYFLTNYG